MDTEVAAPLEQAVEDYLPSSESAEESMDIEDPISVPDAALEKEAPASPTNTPVDSPTA
jgi:hypothetical protein